MKHLIIGGARSGKSAFAERSALQRSQSPGYIATAEPGDDEMAARIARHQSARDDCWQVLEEPVQLAVALAELGATADVIVVDCLTLWLSNCLHAGCWQQEKQHLLSLLDATAADLFLVSNEVGSGVVPMGELSRVFVDESGWLQQELAGQCSHVTTVIAGLPLVLKEP